MPRLPTGTVTFLFTDIEDSTKMWQQSHNAMTIALARHDALLHQIIEARNGYVFKTMGDGFCAVFASVTDALITALNAQLALEAEPWDKLAEIKVRIALHTGEAQERDDDYFGPTLNRCARILSAGHGRQILLSSTTQEMVHDLPPEGISLKPLGEHHLKNLVRRERIFQLMHSSLPEDFPPLRSLDALPNNLPVQLTSFIGRAYEIVQVQKLLKENRMVTLTGVGGCGKTRLALQVGAEVLDNFIDGVWLVELAALADPTLVPQAIASAVGIREEPNRELLESLLDYLEPKELLIIFDNCEHMTGACAEIAERVLQQCPNLRLMATSREALRVGGETVWRGPSLSMPEAEQMPAIDRLAQYEAVELFSERANVVKPGFEVNEENGESVNWICRRLDGMPLAIELAAARVRVLPPEQIARRLDDRFRLLTGGRRTSLERQRTLEAAVGWSYTLLEEDERELFRRLSVFTGNFSLEAAEAICTDDSLEERQVLDLISELVEKSLIVAEEQNTQRGRYQLYETLRAYAWERLVEDGRAEKMLQRHFDYYLEFVKTAEGLLEGVEQTEWLERLEEEQDNLRAAIEWGLESESDSHTVSVLQMVGALGRFWGVRGYWTEGREMLDRTLKQGAHAPLELQAKAMRWSGGLALRQGEFERGKTLSEKSLQMSRKANDQQGVAGSLNNLGIMAREQGNYEEARAFLEESLTIRRKIGDKWGISNSLNNLGVFAQSENDYDKARAYQEESISISREIGDKRTISLSLNNLGILASSQNDANAARRFWEESLQIKQEIGDKYGISMTLQNLGVVATDQGDYEAAQGFYQQSLSIRRELGNTRGIAFSLEGAAKVALAQGQTERAARLYGSAEALRSTIETPLSPADRHLYDHDICTIQNSLDDNTFASAWAEGQSMGLNEAISYALDKNAHL